MSDFRFANPTWSHALWLVAALVALLVWLEWRRGDLLSRFLSATMQSRLVHRMSRTRRLSSIGCLGLAAVALVVALMRPQWGLTYHKTPRVGAQIMVCLDVSKSMLAEDIAPNRLGRAKAEITDLLSFLDGDQVGLIAFAGRASVLCPLTPDFGFFKLILDGADPNSVGRGGTRLEEPIRKALDGFRTESDVSRVLLLITDGEDHDSHPLDAAKAAAERGVKILAIGFGDEGGSPIEYTDPRTGARTTVRDSDGNTVISRLDGETLRDLALATDGAYIPAGTGMLDLKSIYDAHIAPLVRGRLDDRGHAVRREGFQWAVLAGLVMLVASVVTGSGSVKSELGTWDKRPRRSAVRSARTSGDARATSLVLCILVLFVAATTQAQEKPTEPDQPAAKETEAGNQPPADETDPRDMYNEALAYIGNDTDRAERLLTEARREAGTDGEVRFRATYNMGWVEVKRADRLLDDEKPEDALAHLRRAADWFRDAVRLRPDHRDARHNLEVVLRRILELADSLAKSDERDLAQRLDALIAAQRNLVAGARQLVQRVASEAADDPNAADRFRSDFRQLAVEQRKLLSDSQAVSKLAGEELDALSGKQDQQKSPQEQLRAAQLANLLQYAHRANERLGQARSQMRRRQAERSFRRAAAGLIELKRARDQLRNPVEILDVIIADAMSLERMTALEAAVAEAPPVADQPAAQAPAWLTREYLEESQLALTERTVELADRLQAGLEQQESRPAGPPTPEQQQQDAEANRLLEKIRQAMPLFQTARESFAESGTALAAAEFTTAVQQQRQGIVALRAARERFLELRGLIELAYQFEVQVQQLLSPPDAEGDGNGKISDAQRADLAKIADSVQEENLQRSQRIAKLIDETLSSLPNPPPDGDDGDPADPQAADPAAEQAAAQRQRLELAKQILTQARDEMAGASESIRNTVTQRSSNENPDEPPSTREPGIDDEALRAARDHVDRAVEHLQSLRRLFYSVVEHLRETAQRQAQLNDETEQVAALEDDDAVAKRVGPIGHRQQELRAITEQIARALDEQAKQQPAPGNDPMGIDPQQLQQLQQVTKQFADAAKLVADGGDAMQQAGEALSAETPVPAEARPKQDEALEKLVEALALLTPPQQNQQNQQQKKQQQPQAGGDDSEQQDKQEQQQQAQGTDPSRLLQAVRDREAQRRRDRERRRQIQREPVEKDW